MNLDIGGQADLFWDFRRPLVFCEDGFFQYAYSEHVLEHFERREAQEIVSEVYRVLRPSGVFRVALPNLDHIIHGYLRGWKDEKWAKEFSEFYGGAFSTSGEFLDICFRRWGHRYLYNFEDLEKSSNEPGFQTSRE